MHTNDNRINIIHISDTHIRLSNLDQLLQYREALVKDIKKNLSEEEIKSSIICFTGDLINQGNYGYNEEKQYSIATDNFIIPLLLDLDMDLESFFIVPGNHEVDRSKINSIYDNGLKETLKDYTGTLSIDYSKETSLRERFDDFRKFEMELFKICSDDIVNVRQITINNFNVGVCLINTSWNLASDSQNDKGKVIIGQNLLTAALRKMKLCDYKICLMHHSSSWLRDEDAMNIEPLLAQFDLVLCGHSHYASQKQVYSPNGKSIYCMASESLPLSSQSGYNIIKFYGNQCVIMQRLFYRQRMEFDADLNIPEGKQLFIIGKEDYKSLLFNSYIHTRKGFFNKLNTISMTSLIRDSQKSFDEYYIPPTLLCETETVVSQIENKGNQQSITPLEIIASSDNYVIYGKKEYGKTLLLYYIAEQYYLESHNQKLPIIIDCKKLRNTENSILKEIRNYLHNISDDDFSISVDEIVRILESGMCVLLFDNFVTGCNADAIADFSKKYCNNKRIFTILQTPSTILENRIADEINENKVQYRRVFMSYMSKNDIRKMAQTLSSCERSELTSFTNRIVACFNKTYLPRTPFAVALVVEVCNANADYEPVNLSALIKRYMEIVLDRLSPRELLINEYTFDIKEDFLSYIAACMVRTNSFEVSIDEFDRWTQEYHDFNGFSVRDTHFDEYFFRCQVLSDANGYVSFKYACLLEYYIGKFASQHQDFLVDILAKDKFMNFTSEIVYCAGIDTRNPQIIDTLATYLQESIDDKRIDTSFLSGDKIKLELAITDNEVQATIIDQQMTEQEVDIATDTTDTSSEYLPSRINKTQSYEDSKFELDYFDKLLSTFGSSIRNSELIGYSNRYQAFCQYIKGAMYWCSILAESVEEFVKVVREEIKDNDKVDADKLEILFRDFCRIIIPCMAELNLYESMGSKKLSRIFINHYHSIDDYSSLEKFLSLLIALDIKVTKWQDLFEDFLQKCKSKDLKIILFIKMVYLYKICHFGKKNNEYLANKLFLLKKSINKEVGAFSGKNKTKFINDINKMQNKKPTDDN